MTFMLQNQNCITVTEYIQHSETKEFTVSNSTKEVWQPLDYKNEVCTRHHKKKSTHFNSLYPKQLTCVENLGRTIKNIIDTGH